MNTSTGIGIAPQSVSIVALGFSKWEYLDDCTTQNSRRRISSQTWGINSAVDVLRCDLGFLMDSPGYFLEASKTNPALSGYGDWLWRSDNPPIFTCVECPEYPCIKAFPYKEVVGRLGISYFNSTPAYAMAYAIFLGVKSVRLYGMDYHYERESNDGQKGRACLEYWIGHAVAKGMEVKIATKSPLCDQNTGRPPYGFPDNPDQT